MFSFFRKSADRDPTYLTTYYNPPSLSEKMQEKKFFFATLLYLPDKRTHDASNAPSYEYRLFLYYNILYRYYIQ